MSPRNRTVLTTGANSGIGLVTVLALARAGFRSVGSVRSEEKAEAVRREAKKAGLRVNTVVLDVTDAKRGRRGLDKRNTDRGRTNVRSGGPVARAGAAAA